MSLKRKCSNLNETNANLLISIKILLKAALLMLSMREHLLVFFVIGSPSLVTLLTHFMNLYIIKCIPLLGGSFFTGSSFMQNMLILQFVNQVASTF